MKLLSLHYRAPAEATSDSFPLVLNTGRIRDQWHTMTRTGRTARLTGHISEPYVEIHPLDAERCGVADGTLADVRSSHGQMIVRVRVGSDQRPGSVFVPMHWSERYAQGSPLNTLVGPHCDPVSGEPESKHTPVAVTPFSAGWHGFALSRQHCTFTGTAYRVMTRLAGAWRYDMAGTARPGDWARWIREALPTSDFAWLEYADANAGRYRCALFDGERLEFCLFVDRGTELPARNWLAGLFALDAVQDPVRKSLLSGKPMTGREDSGRMVCSCFNIGLNTLKNAIRDQALQTTEDIGASLKAGTHCGSCLPELRMLLPGKPVR
jgi:assimilatory nitrate reductase catalytic subunit